MNPHYSKRLALPLAALIALLCCSFPLRADMLTGPVAATSQILLADGSLASAVMLAGSSSPATGSWINDAPLSNALLGLDRPYAVRVTVRFPTKQFSKTPIILLTLQSTSSMEAALFGGTASVMTASKEGFSALIYPSYPRYTDFKPMKDALTPINIVEWMSNCGFSLSWIAIDARP